MILSSGLNYSRPVAEKALYGAFASKCDSNRNALILGSSRWEFDKIR